jgi:RNA polymerase-binding transcription factor DksA
MSEPAADAPTGMLDLEELTRIEGELADVERALQRLDDGSYGTCEACHEPLGDEVLAATPAARSCAAHQPAS